MTVVVMIGGEVQSYSGGDGGRCRVTVVVMVEVQSYSGGDGGGAELQWW